MRNHLILSSAESMARKIKSWKFSISKDIGRYSNSVQFETEVYDGVYWVPLNTLGTSRYSNKEMLEISKMPLERKRECIDNLYEAVQLFQISQFQWSMDNKEYSIDDIHWNSYKSPEEAVLSNEGHCATDTNWLAYFIHDKYDSVGSLCYTGEVWNGRYGQRITTDIITYIKFENEYYFIDMRMCRKDSQDELCKENGSLPGLMGCLGWPGFLYRCKNPVDFCPFHTYLSEKKYWYAPYFYYLRRSSFATATGVQYNKKGFTLYVPKKEDPSIINLQDFGYGYYTASCIDPPIALDDMAAFDISFIKYYEPDILDRRSGEIAPQSHSL